MSGETQRIVREAARELQALDPSAFRRRFPDSRSFFTRTEDSGSVYEIGVEWAESEDGSISVVATAEDVTLTQLGTESEAFVLPMPS